MAASFSPNYMYVGRENTRCLCGTLIPRWVLENAWVTSGSVAKPARILVMQLQILNDYHYSFL